MLRNSKDLEECVVGGTDGTFGHVQDLCFDEETWAIRYLIVNTSHWWIGSQVLLATQWIGDVNWFSSNVTVNLSCETLKNAPPYDAALPLDRRQELAVFEYFGRPGYWTEVLPPHAREERQINTWEDDGGTVAVSPSPKLLTLDRPELLQMPLP